MKNERSLTSLTIVYTLGNFVAKLISFVLIFSLTYFLSREEIGNYDLILTTILFFVPFISIQIDSAILRWLIDDKSDVNISSVVTNSIGVVLLNTAAFSILYFVFICFYNIENFVLIYVLAVLQILLPTFQQICRGMGKSVLYIVSGIIYAVLYAVLTFIFLITFHLRIDGVLLANIVSTAVVLIYIAFKSRFYVFLNLKILNKNFALKLLKYSLPLMPNSISWWAVVSANKYLIVYFLGASANGLFTISFKYPSIIFIFSSIFNMAWQEKSIAMASDSNKDAYYSYVLEKYIKFVFSVVIVLCAVSRLLMKYIVEASFIDSWKYISILLVAIATQAIAGFYGVGYLSSKETKGAFMSSAWGSIATIICSTILIPLIGLYGASLSILLGYSVMLAIRVKQSKKYFNIKFPAKLIAIFTAAVALITYFNYVNSEIVIIINIILSIVAACGLNASFIKKMYNYKIYKNVK
jgi:O-antigen/teichoic acid export membrane protein